jgi:hypothetical protein
MALQLSEQALSSRSRRIPVRLTVSPHGCGSKFELIHAGLFSVNRRSVVRAYRTVPATQAKL